MKRAAETLEPIPAPQVHQVIRDRLTRFLVSGGLKPGDQIPSEHELASQLQTSRSAVREALRALEAIGVIDVQRGKGRFLKRFSFEQLAENVAISLTLDEASISDLLEVRRSLELSFLPQAADMLTEEQLQQLRQTVNDMRAKADADEAFIVEDMAFHKQLFSGTKNELLKELLDTFWQLFQHVHGKNILPPGQTTTTVEYHAQIVTALEERDIPLAQRLLEQHFEDVRSRLINT